MKNQLIRGRNQVRAVGLTGKAGGEGNRKEKKKKSMNSTAGDERI